MERGAPGQLNLSDVLGGAYRIDRELGRGGMGCVYAATQLRLERQVAIKTMLGDLLHDERSLARFYREARASTRLHGPHVVKVYDFGVDEVTGIPYIVMELLRGRTLRDLLTEQPSVRPRRAAGILEQVCLGLVEAEEHGMVHRDLKCENIMLLDTPDARDYVRVMDFGVVKFVGRETAGLSLGGPVGTPRTMAPEQVTDGRIDFRTDLYAVGGVLYELLTGNAPHGAVGSFEAMAWHMSPDRAPPVPPEVGAPPALVELCAQLLEKDRERRPASVAAVAARLGAIARGESLAAPAAPPTRAVGPALWALVGAVSVALVLVGWVSVRAMWPRAPIVQLAPALPGASSPEAAPDGVARADSPQPAAAPPDAPRPSEPAPTGAEPAEPPVGPGLPSDLVLREPAVGVRVGARRALAPAPPAAAPAPVRAYVVRSRPPSRAYRGAESLGRTPVTIDLRDGAAPVRLRLSASGYRPSEVTVRPGDQTPRLVVLRPLQTVGSGSRPKTGNGGVRPKELWPPASETGGR